jgi:hypothetical protein
MKGAGRKMSRTLTSALREYSKVLWENTRKCFGRILGEHSRVLEGNTRKCVERTLPSASGKAGDLFRFIFCIISSKGVQGGIVVSI